MATVTIDLEQFDAMRTKAKAYDDLKEKHDRFPQILKNRMANVLASYIEMKSGETDYNKMPKMNVCEVIVDHEKELVYSVEIQIAERGSYYDAKIICHYK